MQVRHTHIDRLSRGFAAILLLAAAVPAAAQGLNNKPYDFGGRGLGISPAGKQLILYDQLYGVRPDNVMVAPNGTLLTAVRGPSGSAIVFDDSNTIVPGYSGRSWSNVRYDARLWSRMSYVDRFDGATSTYTAMSGWTGMVAGADDEFAFAKYLLPTGFDPLDLLLMQVQML